MDRVLRKLPTNMKKLEDRIMAAEKLGDRVKVERS